LLLQRIRNTFTVASRNNLVFTLHFAVTESEQAVLKIDLTPPQTDDFVTPITGQHPQMSDVERLGIHTFGLKRTASRRAALL
jgi:hypothetical protein